MVGQTNLHDQATSLLQEGPESKDRQLLLPVLRACNGDRDDIAHWKELAKIIREVDTLAERNPLIASVLQKTLFSGYEDNLTDKRTESEIKEEFSRALSKEGALDDSTSIPKEATNIIRFYHTLGEPSNGSQEIYCDGGKFQHVLCDYLLAVVEFDVPQNKPKTLDETVDSFFELASTFHLLCCHHHLNGIKPSIVTKIGVLSQAVNNQRDVFEDVSRFTQGDDVLTLPNQGFPWSLDNNQDTPTFFKALEDLRKIGDLVYDAVKSFAHEESDLGSFVKQFRAFAQVYLELYDDLGTYIKDASKMYSEDPTLTPRDISAILYIRWHSKQKEVLGDTTTQSR
jgi:hypothetical protein